MPSLADWIALRRPKYRKGGLLAWLAPNTDLVRWGPYRPVSGANDGLSSGNPQLPTNLEREEYFAGDFNQCRIIGPCTITRVDFYVARTDAHSQITEVRFRLWRAADEQNVDGTKVGQEWVAIYETENFESLITDDGLSGRVVQCTLTTPWVCQQGDAISAVLLKIGTSTTDYFEIVSLSAAEARHRDDAGTGDITDLGLEIPIDWDSYTTGQVSNNVLTLRAMGQAPSVVCIGDSWVSGTINSAGAEDGDSGYCGTDLQAVHGRHYGKSFPAKLAVLLGRSVMKMAVHGRNTSDVDGVFTNDVINRKPKAVVICCVGNDANVPTALATFMARYVGWFDAMDTAGIKYVVLGGGPYTGFTDQAIQRVVEYNTALQTEIALRPNGRYLDMMELLGKARTITPNTNSVTGATNANPIVITTAAGHSLSNGERVTITGVGGNTAANGTFIVASTNSAAGTFALTDLLGANVAGNGVYTSGGTWIMSYYTGNKWNMKDGTGGDPDYESDTQHTTETGYTAIAAAVLAKLQSFG